ncbi:radial spoke head protein 3 homolog B-like [Astyanax mexicanus]|uniref:radial spoke head protein 3 homolog B-like n=1 Tax=Astyanax mexicanus TaxID=7994 RepID=UPI0020CB0007|nr:radial spoke head protein 3 homolog B-like isoform X1 [Astyanax mexicanus]XP_049335504.1 radial spoke head protein 3 homolog B-like isoform X2 [Astyanax mexicanus]XP_049335505.1 radial spoke head protein 3 homolog B-like isoform X3 [Astyanax mexicanus]XP_049335506.1 radial spoke head protein 3 homolog B-like isoform X4 [Astyanax mexicanus]XP_049335507.1 radial spoke head protein 3 homolog B-like isoform X5 [Astyanax mexicanus]XP_049335508.1 radial spoke head protein 3 homolog B-like isoform
MASQRYNQAPNGAYVSSTRPQPASTRLKYKDPAVIQNEGSRVYGNIMYDRRVVRGNTYAKHTLTLRSQPDPAELKKKQEARRRALERKMAKEQFRLLTPKAPEGRKHTDVQTELYLEELSDHPEDASMGCQTDAFLDEPATPLFIPAKSGKDVATQIEEGELFDFDTEVQPVLEVLIGKPMEQALLEVLEEEELASLRAQQRAFQELRNAELVEVQRLEEQERRHREEKVRRLKQQREVLENERVIAEKIAARGFAQQYLADLLPSVYNTLREQGYFYDPVQRDIETGFLPWLMAEVDNALEKREIALTVLDTLTYDVANSRQETSKD